MAYLYITYMFPCPCSWALCAPSTSTVFILFLQVFSSITLLANPSEVSLTDNLLALRGRIGVNLVPFLLVQQLPITKKCVILARSMIASCLICVCDIHGQLLQVRCFAASGSLIKASSCGSLRILKVCMLLRFNCTSNVWTMSYIH